MSTFGEAGWDINERRMHCTTGTRRSCPLTRAKSTLESLAKANVLPSLHALIGQKGLRPAVPFARPLRCDPRPSTLSHSRVQAWLTACHAHPAPPRGNKFTAARGTQKLEQRNQEGAVSAARQGHVRDTSPGKRAQAAQVDRHCVRARATATGRRGIVAPIGAAESSKTKDAQTQLFHTLFFSSAARPGRPFATRRGGGSRRIGEELIRPAWSQVSVQQR